MLAEAGGAVCLAGIQRERGKKMCANNLHVAQTEPEGMFPTGSALGSWQRSIDPGKRWDGECARMALHHASTCTSNEVFFHTMDLTMHIWFPFACSSRFLINFRKSSLIAEC